MNDTPTPALAEGDAAPEFSLPASGGRIASLAGLKGRPFLLYFYPKADTPGCTRQACGIQEALPQLGRLGLEIVGVSPDKLKPIEKFSEKFSLTFPLASDDTTATAQAYGVWVEKSMYGRKYMGMERSSFLIDGAGRIVKIWRKVKPEAHAGEVLAAAKGLK
jgi:peroxiredoxin Q/BCP